MALLIIIMQCEADLPTPYIISCDGTSVQMVWIPLQLFLCDILNPQIW